MSHCCFSFLTGKWDPGSHLPGSSSSTAFLFQVGKLLFRREGNLDLAFEICPHGRSGNQAECPWDPIPCLLSGPDILLQMSVSLGSSVVRLLHSTEAGRMGMGMGKCLKENNISQIELPFNLFPTHLDSGTVPVSPFTTFFPP